MEVGGAAVGLSGTASLLFVFFLLNFSPSRQNTPYLYPTFLHRRAFRVLLSFLPKFRHGEVGYMTCSHVM
jgi:hypothetical protein